MINLKIRINVDEQTFTLPVDTQFVPGIPEKDLVVTVTEITEPEELKYLERDEWNIEELNFLAKRMESFDKREQSQFDAAVSIFRPKTVEALINYTYNLPRFTLISDFSTPNAIGVSHILNRKQVMSLDEMASTDFAKIGKELMQSGKGITTPYGVLFVNEDIPFEPVYDGRHFPEYDYKGSLATVAVSRKGETEYLYLPCSIQDTQSRSNTESEVRNMWIVIITALLAAVGLALILSDAFRVPTYAVAKATHNLGKRQNKKTNPLELWLREVANWLSGKLRLNEYKRLQLEADLKTADINMTPEMYTANAIVKAGFIALFGVPLLFFSKLLALLVLGIAAFLYYFEIRKVGKAIRERRKKIEYELPRLVANIEKTLIHSRDVLAILDAYKETAGSELKRELEITVADMRSGNYEVALTRLEARVGSTMMSDVTRGLIGVIRGDETSVYWGSLVLKFSDYQRQNLKTEASKAPKKVRKLSMVLLICFMLVYVAVIGEVLLSSLGGLFG